MIRPTFAQLTLLALVIVLFTAPDWALAADAGMPWEAPLDKITRSLTGPVAMAISLLGIVVAGGMLIFGGELGEFVRRLIMLVLVIALIVTAASFLSTLFGVNAHGATSG